MIKEPRLRFTEEERADPALEKPIRKAEKAAAKADKVQAKIPKKQVKRAIARPPGPHQPAHRRLHFPSAAGGNIGAHRAWKASKNLGSCLADL